MSQELLSLIPLAADNSDLSSAEVARLYRESRDQFIAKTQEFGIKHTFSFDEAFHYLLSQRKRKEFRDKVMEFQRRFVELPEAVFPNTPQAYPVEQDLVGGLYRRRLFVPAGIMTVTKIHAQNHFWFLEKGRITVWSEEGQHEYQAPATGITLAGTKRVIMHHDEVIFTTVHRTDLTDVAAIEQEITADSFETLPDRLSHNLEHKGELI